MIISSAFLLCRVLELSCINCFNIKYMFRKMELHKDKPSPEPTLQPVKLGTIVFHTCIFEMNPTVGSLRQFPLSFIWVFLCSSWV